MAHINTALQRIDGAAQLAKEGKAIAQKASAKGDEVLRQVSIKANKSDIADFKRCIVLTLSEYNALSTDDKNRTDTLYFIKE